MPYTEISPADRDLMIRTVISEADDRPPVGQAAVAHTILNRVNYGGWGDTPSEVVLSRDQFEPWSTRARELSAIKPESDRYRRVAGVVDDVLSGRTPDPTGGATHFLDPEIVKGRRGGTLPDWARGSGLRMGDHAFFRPAEMGPAPDGLGGHQPRDRRRRCSKRHGL
jgi:spore germination cell wall hydrolase CwlJ-like protein